MPWDKKVFVVAGKDSLERAKILEDIKKKLPQELWQPGISVTIFAGQATLPALQEDVLTFSLAGEKAVIFKQAQLLEKDAADYLAVNLGEIARQSYLIFEFEESLVELQAKAKKDNLVSALLLHGQVYKMPSLPLEIKMDSLMKAVWANDLSGALYALEKILESERIEGVSPVLVGALNAHAAKLNNIGKKRKSLQYLLSADRALKESRNDKRAILEALLIKLFKLV
jgi:hypothetical protein